MTSHDQAADFAAFVGLDWADASHQVCLRAVGSARDEQRIVWQKPEALQAWARELAVRFGGRKIAVAIEQSRGPVIYALMQHAHLVLYPINPAMLAKYRAAATAASGVKDDPLDAGLACELVRLHRDWLRPLALQPAQVRQLQMLLEARRAWVEQRCAWCEQLGAALKSYFPQALQLVGTLDSPLCWALLRRWPTLAAIQKARPETLRRFYQEHGVHSTDEIEQRLSLVRTAVALTDDAAVLAAMPVQVTALISMLPNVRDTVADYDQRVKQLFSSQPDAALFAAFPGAGAQLAPRLYVAFGPDRGRYQSPEQIQCYSGIAPVKKKSGDGLDRTQWRWHCPKFLRQSFHEFAGCSVPQSTWAHAYYHLQIERGKTPEKAKRALAFKWQRIIFRCWQTREPYDEVRYLAALRLRGSPLVAYIDRLTRDAA
jgi:transposase